MSEPYLLTVYIAERGTPHRNPETGAVTKSGGGHMWYGIRKGEDAEKTYGFAPKNDGRAFDAGKVVTNDNETYYRPHYTRTIEITEQQYKKLNEFGENGVLENWSLGFDGKYNLLNNSCVDFTWSALKYAKFEHVPISFFPNLKRPITSDGDLWPGNNWNEVQKIVAPFPNSPYNRIYYGLPAKDAFDELSANKQHATPPAPAETPAAAPFELRTIPTPLLHPNCCRPPPRLASLYKREATPPHLAKPLLPPIP